MPPRSTTSAFSRRGEVREEMLVCERTAADTGAADQGDAFRVSIDPKKAAAIGGGVLALAAAAFFVFVKSPAEVVREITEPPRCPLTNVEPKDEAVLDRPAIAVKIENNPVAYPLSGLEDAEVVYEELVEGGITRFMAIYHCTDSSQAGPVRSARLVDPAIMKPYTSILAFAGANDIVDQELSDADLVLLTESTDGFERIPREGITSEHTLYVDTRTVRKQGEEEFTDAPPEVFSFGDLPDGAKKTTSVDIEFSGATHVRFDWDGKDWLRFDGDAPLLDDAGNQIAVDNVLIEEHDIQLSTEIVDTAGNPSVEISDQTGSGRAVLFRDGRAIVGKWTREDIEEPVAFETKNGNEMELKRGTTWIELVPSQQGEVKGSFSYE